MNIRYCSGILCLKVFRLPSYRLTGIRKEEMPIYEYRCRECGVSFQKLLFHEEEEADLRCRDCGAGGLQKLISRVAYHVSEADRLAEFKPGTRQDDSFYKDSRNIGLQAKKRAQQMGVDLGRGFEEKLERLRTDPGSVIKDSE